MAEFKIQGGIEESISLNDSKGEQDGIGAPVLPLGEDGVGFTQNDTHSKEGKKVARSKPKAERGNRGPQSKFNKENEERGTRAKPKIENGAKVPRAKSAKSKVEGSPRARPKKEAGVRGKTKAGVEEKAAESTTKPRRVKQPGGAASLYTYAGAGVCAMTLVGILSFVQFTYLRIPDDQLFAYLLGPLHSLGLMIVVGAVYTVFKSLDFGRILPWIWALGGLGMVFNLNVFWPQLYADLAIPSKTLGIISFVGSLVFLKYYFHKLGRIVPRKRSKGILTIVVSVALIGAVLPLASEFQYLLPDPLYGILVEHMPEVGFMVLWPLEYFEISSEIGLSNFLGYGSWLSNENVVSMATTSLKIASNMVTFAAIGFVLGWVVFGYRMTNSREGN